MVKRRFDNLPMNRRGSAMGASLLTDPAVLYEVREVEPGAEEVQRRLGSARVAQYATSLGLTAPAKGSFFAYDDVLNLAGDWSVGFSAMVGDVAEDTGEWTALFAGRTANTDLDNSFRVYLKRNGSDYEAHLTFTDSSSTLESVTPIVVTPGDNVDFLVTKSGTTVTLNVDASSQSTTLAGTYNLGLVQIQIGGTDKITARPKGQAPVVDNIQAWASVVTTAVYQDRSPTGSPFLSVLPSEIGGDFFEPATSAGPFLAHPAAPPVNGSKLYFSGFGGAVKVPFRGVFERYFQTSTEIAQSQKFAVRIKGQRGFHTDVTQRTLVDFGSDEEGFLYISINTSGNPIFEYNGTTVTSSAIISTDTDFSIIAGCNGTTLYLQVDGTENTASVSNAPYLDYARIPDLYVGNDEDPAEAKGFHGYLTNFEFFDYAFREDTATAVDPVLALDFSGDYVRDNSQNRIAVAAIPHAETEGSPYYAEGPLTDQAFKGVEANLVVGPGASGYKGSYRAPFAADVSGIRVGDRAFLHSGDHVHVLNSEVSQVRPLGLPEPETEVSTRALGTGSLDGAYSYGYRWVSQDGTYGPLKRLKPVKATGQASVLIGAGEIDGGESRRELGESYGLTEDGAAETFSLTDSADGVTASGTTGYSVESYLRFPDFDDLEELISDRGVTGNFTDKPTLCVEPDQPIEINPNGDFCLQFAFRFDKTVVSGETYATQGLMAIGHEDPGPTTRSVMLFIDEDSTYGTEDAVPRMVFARSLGLKDSRYRYLIFNNAATEGDDSAVWEDGHDYSIQVVRDGDDLRIHVYDATDNTWHDFEGGECVGFFSGYDFPHNKRDFRVSNAAFRKTGGSGNHWEGIANLPTANSGTNYSGGTYGYRDYGTSVSVGTRQALRLGWMDRGSRLYHARAWSRAWPKATIKSESLKRFSAVDGAMVDRVKSDVAFFNEDPSANDAKFYDKISGQYWRVYKADTDTGGLKNPAQGQITNVQGSPTIFDGTIITDTGVSSPASAHYRLSATSLGDGSIILTTNEASYTLSTKQWDDTASAAFSKPLEDLDIDLQQFNWFTTGVAFVNNSGDFDVSVLDLYINGNKIFDATLGEFGTPLERTTENLVVYLGGNAVQNNDGDVHIGEFRLWNKNRYDDSSEEFDYLTGRVKASEWSDLFFYATFEPADEVTATTYNHRGTLSSDLLTLLNGASIVDERTTDNSGVTDPAPVTSIPQPPYKHITAVEIFRTIAYPIDDPQDEGEVQRALQAVRGQPMYLLARVPAGDPSYVDISPDDGLGQESPEAGTGTAPERPNGVGIWQNQLLLWRSNNIWFAEVGPRGWDSFPTWLRYSVPVVQAGDDIVACVEVEGALVVCGKSWTTLLTGAPSNPRALAVGAGPGCQSAQALVSTGLMAYGLGDGKLWRYQGGQIDETFGLPVQDLLPSTGLLALSGDLSSLFVVDTTSDQVLRFHMPTQRWTIEERDAAAIGDVNGAAQVVHSSGSHSATSSTLYGDDVTSLTADVESGTIASASTVSVAANPNAPVGSRVLVIDGTGKAALTRVVSYA